MAPTYTTRIALVKPDANDLYDISTFHNASMDIIDGAVGIPRVNTAGRPGSPFLYQAIYDTDVAQILVWDGDSWETASNAAQVVAVSVVTSGTRPSSPTSGRLIYETDTKRLMVYNGTAWRTVSGGLVGGKRYSTAATLGTLTTTETVVMSTGSRTLEGGRSYRCRASVESGVATANAGLLYRCRLTNASGTILGEYRARPCPLVTGTARFHDYMEFPFDVASDTTLELVLTAQRYTGSGNVMVYGAANSAPELSIVQDGISGLYTAV